MYSSSFAPSSRSLVACALCALVSAGVSAAPKASQLPASRCQAHEVAVKITDYQDLADRVHIEWQEVRSGIREAIDVAKPGHRFYERHYRKGAVVCRALPEPPAGG